ncbi:hypothetical protein VPAL9027_02547 [Vibrio palustris]|uniref:Uncharacterized protein n=1 Tax=Vibrio palustris TaxID=1918946 RepID=A0A1R4B6K5_9VIBR|nr:hypothetical protein VPAL9027_02547 [Vibrio palustris]
MDCAEGLSNYQGLDAGSTFVAGLLQIRLDPVELRPGGVFLVYGEPQIVTLC